MSGTGGQAVFTLQDGRAIRRTVQTGMTSEGRVEVVAGLGVGDTIVVAGSNTLRDGSAVRVVGGPGATGAPTGVDDAADAENRTSGGAS